MSRRRDGNPSPRRPRSRCRGLLLAAVCLLLAPGARALGSFPNLLQVGVAGGATEVLSDVMLGCLPGTKVGTFDCSGAIFTPLSGDWELSAWNISLDQDPKIAPNFTIKNTTNTVQTYTMNFVLPVLNTGPATNIRGSVGVTATDADGSGSGGWATVAPRAFYTGLIDGVLVVPNAELLPHPSGVNFVISGQTKIEQDQFGLNTWGSGPALATNIGIRFRFDLSPGDSIGVTSFFEVIPVPEPSTAALAGLGLLGLLAAGRRVSS